MVLRGIFTLALALTAVSAKPVLGGNDPLGKHRLSIVFKTEADVTANVHYAIYDQERHFLSEHTLLAQVLKPGMRSVGVDVSLPEGRYAIAAYVDENGNGRLDKNFMGYPLEPYGFSAPRLQNVFIPTWDNTSFFLQGDLLMPLHIN